MNRPVAVNGDYLKLAYRRALLLETISHIESFTGNRGMEPQQTILSQDVFQGQSRVPLETITEYLAELRLEEQQIYAKMSEFTFTRNADDDQDRSKGSQKSEPSQEVGRKNKQANKGGARQRKGNA